MQSSSAARAVFLAATIAVTLVYFPAYLTPDALAQSVGFPSPVLTNVPDANQFDQSTTTPPAFQTNYVATSTPKISEPVQTNVQQQNGERLVIPSINLNDPIIPVGTDATGAMAVPNGETSEVGWYDDGPQPGQAGSAVLDAHVFAAFKNLNEVKVGDSIYINENGESLHFVVTKVETFALSQITSQDLFVQTNDRDLNLITCAGNLTPDHSTYDHRLVVYSTLEQ
jgi:LPXTG-site transpeptidase (sortase) family protein